MIIIVVSFGLFPILKNTNTEGIVILISKATLLFLCSSMLSSVFTLFEWCRGKVAYAGVLDIAPDFFLFRIFFSAFSMCSLVILVNLMVSLVNEIFSDVRENELYSYDKEIVDYATKLFSDSLKIIRGEDAEKEASEVKSSKRRREHQDKVDADKKLLHLEMSLMQQNCKIDNWLKIDNLLIY